MYQHDFRDAVRPGDKANPVGLAVSNRGEITHAHRHAVRGHQLPVNRRSLVPEVFKRPVSQIDLFRMCSSRMLLHQPQPKLGLPGVNHSAESLIAETARRYRLVPNSNLAETCDHNSNVARSLGHNQVALTWVSHASVLFY